jgi:hypothetical protein
MIDKNETFSFTLLFNEDSDKVILIKKGEYPVKELNEADQVLSSENSEDEEAIKGIISKIPVFEAAEPGSEVTITETLGDLEDKYGISIEELEESGENLSNEQEKSESTEHIEKVLDRQLEDVFEKEKEAMGEYSLDILTDPTAIIPEHKSFYTTPEAFLDESDGYEDIFTAPEIITEAEEVIEEGASMGEAVSAFVREVKPGKLYYSKDIKGLFSILKIYNPEAQLAILNKLPMTGNIAITRDENNIACLKRTAVSEPSKNIDNNEISELLNGPADVSYKPFMRY